jgi:hypothetical protein
MPPATYETMKAACTRRPGRAALARAVVGTIARMLHRQSILPT